MYFGHERLSNPRILNTVTVPTAIMIEGRTDRHPGFGRSHVTETPLFFKTPPPGDWFALLLPCFINASSSKQASKYLYYYYKAWLSTTLGVG